MASIADVVGNDLCIGCGLCEAVTGGRVAMALNRGGSLRPSPLSAMTAEEDRLLSAVCPGTTAASRPDPSGLDGMDVDDVWGAFRSMVMAWAGEDDVRYQASTGGVLTAVGRFLLASGTVAFVLHVGPDPHRPTANRWVMSETPDQVLANAGSRYGPCAPLVGLIEALDRGQKFAVIAKPCDLTAVNAYAAVDERVDQLCVARLAMVCGGQSRQTKTEGLLQQFGVAESDVSLVRYRGYGNPGPTRVETVDGQGHEVGYLDMWADESSWDVETRCKLCPDALGECADVAAADAWPGGAPVGEDEGFNAIVVRTGFGERLVEQAAAAGQLAVGESLTPREFDDLQPHQVRKKEALAARYAGMADAGIEPIATEGLRVAELGQRLDEQAWDDQRAGTRRRMGEAGKHPAR